MKPSFPRFLSPCLCLVAAGFGCAFTREPVVVGAVGPPPSVEARRAPEGRLVVYSALELSSDYSDIVRRRHSNYKLCSVDGKLLKRIENRVTTYLEDPATVVLPPGRYAIVARAAAFGFVTVPVVIEAGKTTWVHVDGSELSSGAQTSTADFVRLPDGLIIGWRAEAETRPK